MAGYPAAANADPVTVDGLSASVSPNHIQPGSGGRFTLTVTDTNTSGATFTNYLLYYVPSNWVVRDGATTLSPSSPSPIIYTISAADAQAGLITIQPPTSYTGGTANLSLGRQQGSPNLVVDFDGGTFDYIGNGAPTLPAANTQYQYHDPTTTVRNSTCTSAQYGPCDGQYSIWPTSMINGSADPHFNNYWADLRSSTNMMPTTPNSYQYSTANICANWNQPSSALWSFNYLSVSKTESAKYGKIGIFNGATSDVMPTPNNLITTTINGLDPNLQYLAVLDVANLSDDAGNTLLPATALYVQTAPGQVGTNIGSTNSLRNQYGCLNDGSLQWTLDSGVATPSASGQLILSARNYVAGGRGNDVGLDNLGLYPMAVVPLALTVSKDTPSLDVSKTSDPVTGSRVTPGQTITYTVLAHNTGNVTLDPVTVTDDLTSVLAHAQPTGTPTSTVGDAPTISGNTLTWTGSLDPDETATLTYKVVVDANVARTDVLTNAVTGTAIDRDDTSIPVPSTCVTGQETGCFSTLTGGQASLVVNKTSNPASGTTVTPGQTVSYTLTAHNTGDVVLTPVVLTDDLSDVLDNATLVTSSLSSDVGGLPVVSTANVLTWTGSLNPDQTVTVKYNVTVKAGAVAPDRLKNAVTGSATDPANPDNPPTVNCKLGTEAGCSSDLPVGAAALQIKKVSNPATGSFVVPGQVVTYTLTAENTGSVPLNPVNLSDNLSGVLNNATIVAGSLTSNLGANPTISASNVLTWSGTLPAGQTVTLTYKVTVNDGVAAPAELKNAVTGSATDPSNPGNPPSVNCQLGTEVGCFSDLSVGQSHIVVAKTSNPPTGSYVAAGQVVTYTLTAYNDGDVAQNPALLTDDLANVLANATIVPGSLTSSMGAAPTISASNVLTWSGTLPVNQTVTVKYQVKVNSNAAAGTHLRNTVTSDNSNCIVGSTDPACNDDLIVGTNHMTVTKTSNPPKGSFVAPGQAITYKLTVVNDGEVAQDPAIMTDDLSGVLSDATIVTSSFTATAGSDLPTYDASTKTLTWSGPLDVGQTVEVTYQIKVNADATAGHTLRNTVISDNSNCIVGSTDPACNDNVVVGSQHFSLVKSSTPPSGSTVTPNQVITYTLTATNDGDLPLSAALISDDLTGVLNNAAIVTGSFTTTSGDLPTYDATSKTLSWTGAMALGQTVRLTYQVKVNANATPGAHLHNSVVGNHSDCIVGSTDPKCNDDVVVGTAGLQISKTSNPATGAYVIPDQVVTYTLTAENTGDVTLNPVNLADNLSDVLDNAAIITTSLHSDVGDPPTFNASTNALTWTGSLASHQIVTITYQVKVNSDAVAPAHLKNLVVGSATNPSDPANPPTTSCATGAEPGCSSDLLVGKKDFTPTKTSNPASGTTVTPNQVITYTLKATNTGDVVYPGAQLIDDLSNVLNNASIVPGSYTTTSGALPILDSSTNILTWTGDLAVGQTVTVTYQVKVNAHPTIGAELHNKVGNCVDGDTTCDNHHPIGNSGLDVNKTSDPQSGSVVIPGQVVTYTLTATNSGEVTLTPVLLTDDLSGVLNNATMVGSPTTDWGDAPIISASKILSWSGSLDPGKTVKVTYQVKVNSDAVAPADLKNKVVGTGTNPGDPNNPPTTTCAIGTEPGCSSDLPVGRSHYAQTKTSNPASGSIVTPNQVITYTLTAYNDGDVVVPDASLIDDLSKVLNNAAIVPGSYTTTSGALPTLDSATNVLTWTGSLALGQTVTVTYQVKVNANPTPGADLENGLQGCGANDPTCTHLQVGAAGLQINKTSSPASGVVVIPGQVVTYTIKATNTGDVTLTPVNLSDDLSGVLSNAALVGTPATDVGTAPTISSANVLTWSGSLTAHQTVTITYQVKVNSNAVAPAKLKNLVIGSGVNPEDPTNPPTTSCATGAEPGCSSTLPVGTAALSVVKTSDPVSGSVVTPGQIVTYTLKATNTGDMTLTPVNLTDDLSGVLSNAALVGTPTSTVGATPTVSTAHVLTWTGSLTSHQTVTVTYQVKVNANAVAPAVLKNKVIGTGTNPGNPSTPPETTCATGTEPGCSSNLPVGKAELTVTKTSNPASGTTVTPNQVIAYTLTATNSGDVALNPVTVTDDLSGLLNNATLVSGSVNSTVGGLPIITSNTLTWTGSLNAHQTATITYQVKVNASAVAGSSLRNDVKASGKDPDNPDNPPDITCVTGTEPDCSTNHPVGSAGLTVTKTSDPPSGTTVVPNQVVTYTLTAVNSGDVTVNPVNLSDDLSGVLNHATFVAGSLSASVGTPLLTGNVISWSGSLGSHQSVVVTYKVKANADVTNTSGSLHNQVTASGVNPDDPSNPPITTCQTGSEPGCSSDLPLGQAKVQYTKTSNPPSGAVVVPNQIITYTLKAINTGDVAIDPATITDDLTGVLTDATLVAGSLASDTGNPPTLAGSKVTWSGPLALGKTATITYQVMVNGDATMGDSLKNVVTGTAKNPKDPDQPPDTNCPTGTEPGCSTDHQVGKSGLTITKTSDPASGSRVAADQVVTYTLTVNNTGDVKLDPATVTDDLSGVLSNAKIVDGSLTTSSGALPTITGTTLTWSGVLDAGKSATITYQVKVDKDAAKPAVLVNKVTGSAVDPNVPALAVASNCVTGTETQCFSTLPLGQPMLILTKVSDPPSGSEVSSGQVVTYTLTAANTGDFNLNPVIVNDDLTNVLQHATLTGTMTASRGSAPKMDGTMLTWSGPLDIGQSVVITYQMQIGSGLTPQDTLKNVVAGHAKNPKVPDDDVPGTCKAGAVGCETDLHGDPPPMTVSTGGVIASGATSQLMLMAVTIACLTGATLLLRRLRVGKA